MYFPFESGLGPEITLFLRTEGDPAAALPAIEAAIRRIEPNAALAEARSLAEVASESVRIRRLVLWLLGIFAAIAVTLAAVGIYGVMSYVVSQRAREIGTRMALGARPADILLLVMRQGAVIAGAGTAAGLAVGLVAARSLRSILYQVSSADPLILAGAAVLLGHGPGRVLSPGPPCGQGGPSPDPGGGGRREIQLDRLVLGVSRNPRPASGIGAGF